MDVDMTESSSSHSTPCHSNPAHCSDDLGEPQWKTKTVPRRKSTSVSFCNEVRVYRHLHLNDVEESERRNSWYSQDELNKVKAECNRTVKLVTRGKVTPYEECLSASSSPSSSSETPWTFRGLEYRTPEGANTRRANKEAAWDKVLDEQEAQYLTGNFDDETIARYYHEATRHCQDAAHLLGLADAYAARQQYDDDESGENSLSKVSKTTTSISPHVRRNRPFIGLSNLTIRSNAVCTVA
jgi:hypothetical protein